MKTKQQATDYMVIKEDTLTGLTAKVNKALKDGYILVGGFAVTNASNGGLGNEYYQAVAKADKFWS